MKNLKKKYGFNITHDEEYLERYLGITHEMMPEFEKCEKIMQQGKPSGYKKLQRLIKKYPNNPYFKSFLAGWYIKRKDFKQAIAVNKWIVSEHPEFLQGKTTLALGHYEAGEFEKMKEILGEHFDLKELYPDRDTFHAHEVLTIKNMEVCYHAANLNFERAMKILDEMVEIDSDSPLVLESVEVIDMHQNAFLLQTLEEAYGERIVPKTAEQPVTSKVEPPKFQHKIMENLYQFNWDLPFKIIDEILRLPRNEVIADLELVLQDSMDRYSYFTHDMDGEEYFGETMFVIHSSFLLAELEAHKSLDKVLQTLTQNEFYTEVFYVNHLQENLWQVIFKLGKNQTHKLAEFLKTPGLTTDNKMPVVAALQQMALHYPDRQNEMIGIYTDLLSFMNESSLEDDVVDSDLIAAFAVNLLMLGDKSFYPILKQLYDKKWLPEYLVGSYEEFINESYDDSVFYKKEVTTIKEYYQAMLDLEWEIFQEMSDELSDDEFDDDDDLDDGYWTKDYTSPIVKPPKVGRNDPCPCGSGKKYKKCCM